MKVFRFMVISLFTLILFTGCGTSKSPNSKKDNMKINTDIMESQTVENLSFTSPSLIYENNNSKFQVTVTNTSSETVPLSKILIHMKDADGNEIVTLEGFIGGSLDANSSKRIDTVYGDDLMNVKKIEYEIIK